MIIVAGLDDIGSGTLACVDPKPAVRSEHWQTISHRATLFQAASPDILPAASQAVGGKFDFALIDGDHSTEGVVRDIRGVVPLLEEKSYLLFHDAYFHEVAAGIAIALRDFEDSLRDCGFMSTEKTLDPMPGIFWGGLRLLRYSRGA